MTARDIVARNLTIAEGVVSELQRTLEEIDAIEAPAPDRPVPVEEEAPAKAPPKKKARVPGPKPSTNGHHRVLAATVAAPGTRNTEGPAKVARALESGPLTQAAVATVAEIPKGSISHMLGRGLERGWWQKTDEGKYELTAAGREELLRGEV